MAYPIFRRTIARLLRRRIRVEGAEHLPREGPMIVVANHQSFLDPPILWLAVVPVLKRRVYFITTEYVWRFFRKLMGQRGIDWLGMLPLVKSEPSQVLDLALNRLQRGQPVAIFPEGTRNRNPEPVLLRGKTGAARLVLATGASVVPVGIISPRGLTIGEALKNFFFSRQPAIVRIGSPLHFDRSPQSSKEDLERVTTELMQAIGQLCGKDYRG